MTPEASNVMVASEMTVDPSIASVFQSESATEEPFAPSLSERVIVFPVLSPALPHDIISALGRSADPHCSLCFVGVAVSERVGELATRRIDLRDADAYVRLTRLPFSHALAALDTSWGAILSDEHFALLGTKPEVMGKLKADNPSLDFERQRLGFEMEFAEDGEWAIRLLRYASAGG